MNDDFEIDKDLAEMRVNGHPDGEVSIEIVSGLGGALMALTAAEAIDLANALLRLAATSPSPHKR